MVEGLAKMIWLRRSIRIMAYACGIVLGVWVASMYLDNEMPMTYHIEGSKITPTPAVAGSWTIVEWNVTINRICPGTVMRQLDNADACDADGKVCENVTTFDRTSSTLSTHRGDRFIKKAFPLPLSVPPRLRYKANVCFQCNLLQRAFDILCDDTPDLIFETIPARADASTGD